MGEKFRILLADDEPYYVEMANGALDIASVGMPEVDVEVTDTRDGLFAFEHVIDRGADLLISDVNMPRLSGPESVRKMFESGGAEREVPYVAFLTNGITSASDRQLLAELMEDPRVLGILPKPINSASVAALLRIASVRKGILGIGVLPEDPAVNRAVETVRSLTMKACSMHGIPINGGGRVQIGT